MNQDTNRPHTGESPAQPGQPLVSVVTPFYNTADYLADCIESVLSQTYMNFEYVLVNNCSTDESLAIAEAYARRDRRIRLHSNQAFLGQVANYNAALELISPASVYTKIVQADDKIFPPCLAEMVRVAESDPKVGIVSALALRGTAVTLDGFPFEGEVVSGRALCREQLLRRCRYFASPTSVLYRSTIARGRKPFYDASRLHEDTENCFEILREWDFGFVKQILTFLRTGNESVTSGIAAIDPFWYLLDHLITTHRFGPDFLSPEEFKSCWSRMEAAYLSHLGECYLLVRNRAFWERHRTGAASIGYTPSQVRLLLNGLVALAAIAVSPRRAANIGRSVLSRVRRAGGRKV
jgi:glycosyltransferase involved in cell wall biosynthesis